MSSFLIPMYLARLSPTISASYSASLLVALKPQHIACWMRSPSGEVRTRLMPAPLTVSVYLELEHSVRLRSSLSACGVTLGVKSTMKSATPAT